MIAIIIIYKSYKALTCVFKDNSWSHVCRGGHTMFDPPAELPQSWCPDVRTHGRRWAPGSRSSPPRCGRTGSSAASAEAPGSGCRCRSGSRCGRLLCCAPPRTWRAAAGSPAPPPLWPSRPGSGRSRCLSLWGPVWWSGLGRGARASGPETLWNPGTRRSDRPVAPWKPFWKGATAKYLRVEAWCRWPIVLP